MSKKERTYHGFGKLPPKLAQKLAAQIKRGYHQGQYHVRAEQQPAPYYTERELEAIVEAFTLFNNVVQRGLPDQLYELFARSLDSKISCISYAKNLIWLAHERDGQAEDETKAFARKVLREIKKRKSWSDKAIHLEYLGGNV